MLGKELARELTAVIYSVVLSAALQWILDLPVWGFAIMLGLTYLVCASYRSPKEPPTSRSRRPSEDEDSTHSEGLSVELRPSAEWDDFRDSGRT